MSTNSSLIKVGGLEVLLLKKNIKNMHLNVLPPSGAVRVSVPKGTHEDTIRAFIATRLPWIKRQQENFSNQARQGVREYVSGESHYFFGKRYLLHVVESNEKPFLKLRGKKQIILTVRPNAGWRKKNELVNVWYRDELSKYLEKAVPKYAKLFGVEMPNWKIRNMKRKWGSCNKKRASLLFNLQLAQKPSECIDYVVAHEIAHLIEKSHNSTFINLLDTVMPKWRSLKDQLNQTILTSFSTKS